jgi:hypothetical protein
MEPADIDVLIADLRAHAAQAAEDTTGRPMAVGALTIDSALLAQRLPPAAGTSWVRAMVAPRAPTAEDIEIRQLLADVLRDRPPSR